MRLCIFADIHGNAPAFRAAFKSLLSEAADVNIFLGDLCGYYYDQMVIYELLCTLPNFVAIKGNHDKMFLSIVNGDDELRRSYVDKYGNSMEHLLEESTPEFIEWLGNMPDYISMSAMSDCDIAGYHGAPWNITEGYVYPDSGLDDFARYSQTLFLLGHTHYPMLRRISSKIITNPGSLGQPRNGSWPTYAVLDTPKKNMKLKQVIYDKSELLDRIHTFGDEHKYLRRILLT